ncbi:hypothetical protein [Rhodopirellula sp. SWK7]|uniref:hypothetical protein n=1 Tax=Rhodopirellula sp. SWK7 TaxID=595460 RepID=UPI0002BD53AF|nr:hypothetical protein [Rhodopirellula sp. SWK7]EMI42890.1 hypothetical protein RRSWK_04703 [Rhodopirellula sp. SWK7]
MFNLIVESQIENGTVKQSQSGAVIAVFNGETVRCYRLGEPAELLWSRSDLAIVGCVFIDEERLLVSVRDNPPLVLSVLDGTELRTLESPVKTTLRTRFGELFSHSNGRLFLRTSYPFALVEIEQDTLVASRSLPAESLTNVVFHPDRLMFAGVVDSAAQEVIFGSFESSPFFCESSLYVLPYVYSLGLSASGRWLHILGSDGEQTKLVSVDLSTREVAGTQVVDLKLDTTLSLQGNDDQVYITPNILPVVNETRVMLFQNEGKAFVVDSVEGDVQELDNPHDQAVCSVSPSHRDGSFISCDWLGKLVRWNLGDRAASEFQPWEFLDASQGVSGSYDARPVRLAQ